MAKKAAKQSAKVVGYKAFDKDLKCRGRQYEVGKEYTHEGDIDLCHTGFHFCENPLDVLDFYPLVDTRFAVIETDGEVKSDKNKSVTNKIKISAELSLEAFVDASVKFIWERCTDSPVKKLLKKLNISDDKNDARLASSGYGARLASSGNDARLASSGYGAQLASSGNDARLASSGYGARLASSGYGARLASSGNGARLASSGYGARLALEGGNSIGAGIGRRNLIKGKKGNWIVLAEFDDNGDVVGIVSGKIDGSSIKEDTWYRAQGGAFVEA